MLFPHWRTPNLLIVSSNGAGFDPVDVDACTGAGVLVVNQSGGNANSVAEHALGMLLTLSKRILESRLGCAVTAIAYPYGWPGSYTAQTKALAAEAGYRLAFAAREGVNRPESLDPYEIRRLGVGSADSLALLRARTALHAAFGNSFL